MSTETLPATNIQSDVQIISSGRRPFRTRAHNGHVTLREFGGQFFNISFSYQVLDRSELDPILAFLARHREGGDSFRFSLPSLLGAPRGSIPGSPVATGGEAVGATSIATTGWTASQTGVLKERDFLRLTGDTKIYESTSDVNSDGTGAATINIWPPLISTATAGAIAVNNPYFTVTCESIRDPQFSRHGFYSMPILLEEYF